ncbi:hypothetical protein NSK_008356 [Nannochloropsis salina CCMP1776]|uniref:Uncharacterized protein n=1 Tax=Nannochloropsis salina CCMP1776 TaxID=1027361 RepID=A0A4D9CRQ5_9STRA|nr:hypothetical protein NSK_008356 [Nannochloropsis salina CCMP1776]|eukprot:TFJ80213.1 hypothetical protein NSK_008356 [Nannochloropsis salina CCMP1776]
MGIWADRTRLWSQGKRYEALSLRSGDMLRGQNLPTRAVPPLPIPSPGPDESRPQTGKKKHRVAMLLPFIGPVFPSWFRTFAASLAARDDGSVPMDWFIFHEGARVPLGYHPPTNVHLIDLRPEGGLARRIVRRGRGVLFPEGGREGGKEKGFDEEEAVAILQEGLKWKPALLIQFKEENLFFETIRQGLLAQASAEGCYSHSLLSLAPPPSSPPSLPPSSSLAIKYALGAFTDASIITDDLRKGTTKGEDETNLKRFHEAVMLRDGRVLRCGNKGERITVCLGSLDEGGGEGRAQGAGEEGALVPVSRVDRECMWWVPRSYQVCLSNTTSFDTVYYLNHTFFKSSPLPTGEDPRSAHSHVEGSFMHFQEWKKGYPAWTTPHFGRSYQGVVLAQEGFVPLPYTSSLPSLPPSPPSSASSETMMDLGPAVYCVRFEASDDDALPRCDARVFPTLPTSSAPSSLPPSLPALPEDAVTVEARARRRRMEGEDGGKGPKEDEITLLLVLPPSPFPAMSPPPLMPRREEEREEEDGGEQELDGFLPQRLLDTLALWPATAPVVVVTPYPLPPALHHHLLRHRPSLLLLPFFEAGEDRREGGRARERFHPLPYKAMVNRGLDAVSSRYLFGPLDPSKIQLEEGGGEDGGEDVEEGKVAQGWLSLPSSRQTKRGKGPILPSLPPSMWHVLQGARQEALLLVEGPLFSFNWWAQPHVQAPVLLLDLNVPPVGREMGSGGGRGGGGEGGRLFVRWLEELGGHECFDAVWAWGLAVLGYRFHALPPASLSLRIVSPTAYHAFARGHLDGRGAAGEEGANEGGANEGGANEGGANEGGANEGGANEGECGCAHGLQPRDVKNTLWKFEQWVDKIRVIWSELRGAEAERTAFAAEREAVVAAAAAAAMRFPTDRQGDFREKL